MPRRAHSKHSSTRKTAPRGSRALATQGTAGRERTMKDLVLLLSIATVSTCLGCSGQVETCPDPWYHDADGDLYGDPADSLVGCESPSGYVAQAGDCDDSSADINPAASESCNGVDDDCNGTTDDDYAIDAPTWYKDRDQDGYGDPSATTRACTQPQGYVSDQQDCDDLDSTINPAALELCDGLDNDCDGLSDDQDPGLDSSSATRWYLDADSDGFGGWGTSTLACEPPSGYAEDQSDCDDDDPGVNPDATETCNGIDDDCDGLVDDGDPGLDTSSAYTWYLDADSDGFGDALVSVSACDPPDGYLADSTDCDDTQYEVNPAAPELCGDGVDNDCDGTATGCIPEGVVDLAEADARFFGSQENSFAGFSVAGVGDTNGDGSDDILLAAPFTGDNDGTVYLFPGPVVGDHYLDDSAITITGREAYALLGHSVAGVGDTDADGFDDILLGAPNVNATGYASGAAYLLTGPITDDTTLAGADATLEGQDAFDQAGFCVSGGGDTNGDGYEDMLVGTWMAMDTGAAYLVRGPVAGSISLADAEATFLGETPGDSAGYSVSGGGDTNGDGLADTLVGAPYGDSGAEDSGTAYLLLGPLSGETELGDAHARFIGERATDSAGISVSLTGDVDGDGYHDILLGASDQDSGAPDAGAVYLVSGPITGDLDLALADSRLLGEEEGDIAGYSTASPGDIDGDGFDDILVGAPGADRGGDAAGMVYLVLGPITGEFDLGAADALLVGENAMDLAGICVTGAGDMDGDHHADILLGAIGNGTGAYRGGAAYLLLSDG